MSDQETPQVAILGKVKVGNEELTIARFRGLKAILAGALVARVMREVPEINKKAVEFRKLYRDTNIVEITPGMAKLPRFEQLGLTLEDFTANGGPIRLPMDPEPRDIIMSIFPDLFDLARKELTKFFALLAISNADLEKADDEDQIETALEVRGKQLVRNGDIDELAELFISSWEVLKDQILQKRDRLEKLSTIPWVGTLLSTPPEERDIKIDEETTQPTSTPDQPTLSIDSPDSTDGADEKPSTESPGTSSSSSLQSTAA